MFIRHYFSLPTLARRRGGVVDSEKQRHVLENISGIFPQISRTRGISIEVNAISELWVLRFMGFCGLEEAEKSVYQAAGGLRYGQSGCLGFCTLIRV